MKLGWARVILDGFFTIKLGLGCYNAIGESTKMLTSKNSKSVKIELDISGVHLKELHLITDNLYT